jgi:hypothetical protein
MFEEVTGPSGVSVEDRLGIEETLTRYCTGIDHKHWTMFRTCWTEDCHASYGDLVFDGADDITDGMERIHTPVTTSQHRLTNIDVLQCDGQHAACRSYVHAILLSPGAEGGDVFHIAGHYHDELVRRDGMWKIDRRHWTTMWTEGNVNVLDFGKDGAEKVGAV